MSTPSPAFTVDVNKQKNAVTNASSVLSGYSAALRANVTRSPECCALPAVSATMGPSKTHTIIFCSHFSASWHVTAERVQKRLTAVFIVIGNLRPKADWRSITNAIPKRDHSGLPSR